MPAVPTADEAKQPGARRGRGRTANGDAPITEAQLKQLARALRSAREGDFSVRLRGEGTFGEVAAEFNEMVERNQGLARELVRVSKAVGREGRITERASSPGGGGPGTSRPARSTR